MATASRHTIGRGFTVKVPSLPGESVRLGFGANHVEGVWTSGGLLFATNLRLVYCPAYWNLWPGERIWIAPLEDVESFDVEPRSLSVIGAGQRRRLRVTLADGERHVFVVNHLTKRLQELRAFDPRWGEPR